MTRHVRHNKKPSLGRDLGWAPAHNGNRPTRPRCGSPSRQTPPLLAALPLLLLLFCGAGCGGDAYRSLPTEDGIPELAALREAAESLPRRTLRVPVGEPGERPVHLAVHETGTGARERVVVLVHGVLSDSRVWRYVAGDLGGEYDLMAVDLPGCGDSDRPDPDGLGSDAYGPSAMARQVLCAVRQCLAARPVPPRVKLVGHSLGGSTVLRMYADPMVREEFADVLSHVDGLVLFAPADVIADTQDPTFRAVAEVSNLEMAIADMLGVARRRVARAVREGVADPRRAPREEADRVIAVLTDPTRRRAAQAMLARAVPLDGGRLDYARAAEIARGYADVTVPCLIVWGEQDDTLPVATGYKLASEIPGARLRVVTQAKHCLPVERPRECAALLREFTRGPGELTGPAHKFARLDPVPGPRFLAAVPNPPPRPNVEVAAAPAVTASASLPGRSPAWLEWASLLLPPGRSRLLHPRLALGVPPLMFFVDLPPARH